MERNVLHQATLALFFILLATGALFGQLDSLSSAILSLCKSIYQLLPPIAISLVVAAAIIYSVGQLFGAELRARANMWSNTILVGGLLGIAIIAIYPSVLSFVIGRPVDCGFASASPSWPGFTQFSITFGGGGVFTVSGAAPNASSITFYIARGTAISGPTEPWTERHYSGSAFNYTSGASPGTPYVCYARALYPDGTKISSGLRDFAVQP